MSTRIRSVLRLGVLVEREDCRAATGGVDGGADSASAGRCGSRTGWPVGIVVVEDDTRAVVADARPARQARGCDDRRTASDRELDDESACDAAGAVHEHPLPY